MKVVGHYRLGQELGSGAFSKVKIGYDISTGEKYAVKIMKRKDLAAMNMEVQIEREISIMKAINHPNVVRLHSVYKTPKRIYLVLDFSEDGELFQKLAQGGPLEENEARKYFQQLIDALDYMHKKKCYHRDLKPENILLSKDGIKITDFGLSTTSLSSNSMFKTKCGTPNYVAPEIFAPEGYEGGPADIWSSGLILFVMLTASLPFDGDSLDSVINQVLRSDLEIPEYVSDGAANLISKICVKDPLTRATIEDIRKDPWFNVNYTMIPGEEVSESSFKIIETIEEFIDEGQNEVTITAFELMAKVFTVDLRGLVDDKFQQNPPYSYITNGAQKDINRKLSDGLIGLNGRVTNINDGELKAVVTNGDNVIAVRIDIVPVKGLTHLVCVNKLRGDHKHFMSLIRRIRGMLVI